MPIKDESLEVLHRGVEQALDYLRRQSTETWNHPEPDEELAAVIQGLDRAAGITRAERAHQAEVRRRRELKERSRESNND